jgi:hypothetical protein
VSSIEDKYSIPLLKLTLNGLNLRAQHRALDSRINLILQDLDIEDFLATRIADIGDTTLGSGLPHSFTPSPLIYLLSSEPSASLGISMFMYICVYVYNCMCISVFFYVFICIRLYIYIHIYVCIYIQILIYLLSSERSASLGLNNTSESTKHLQTADYSNFMKLKYEIKYGSEDLIQESAGGSIDVQDINFKEKDCQIDSKSSHNVKLTLGFIGFNIEQETIAVLLHTGESVASAVLDIVGTYSRPFTPTNSKFEKEKINEFNENLNNLHPNIQPFRFPDVRVNIRCSGLSVAFMDKGILVTYILFHFILCLYLFR